MKWSEVEWSEEERGEENNEEEGGGVTAACKLTTLLVLDRQTAAAGLFFPLTFRLTLYGAKVDFSCSP